MLKFLDWESLNEEQVKTLENTLSVNGVKKLLGEYLRVPYPDGDRRNITIDFHFYNYAFCKEKAFDARKISAFISIMNDLFKTDTFPSTSMTTMSQSFTYFQELLLKHSVQRPPKSIKIFTKEDVGAIFDFTLQSYYRQFKLFKYIFTEKNRVILEQRLPHGVESPVTFPTLSTGLQLLKLDQLQSIQEENALNDEIDSISKGNDSPNVKKMKKKKT